MVLIFEYRFGKCLGPENFAKLLYTSIQEISFFSTLFLFIVIIYI